MFKRSTLLAAVATGLLVAPTVAVAQYGYDNDYGYYDDYGYDYDGEDYEYEAGEGYHEEEWYDPSDWFNDDSRVSYETDRDYDYGYDYDNNYYTSDLYDTEPDYDNYSYTTSELYDDEPDYDDYNYTYTLDERDGSDRDYSNTIGGREYDRDRQNRMTRRDNQRMQRDQRMQQDRYANQSRNNRDARMDRRDREQIYATNRDGRRQMDDRQRQQDQRRQQMSRQGTQQFQGEVQNTQTFQHQGHQHRMVTLRNDQGQRMQVDLGPTQETSDLTLRQGTQVTVQGKRGTVAGRQLIKAMRISTGDDTRIRIDRKQEQQNRQGITGTIQRVVERRDRQGDPVTLVTIRSQQGNTVLADLGRADDLSDLNLREGLRVNARGRTIDANGQKVLIVGELRRADSQSQRNNQNRSQRNQDSN